jgi:hypothetical protein
MVRRQQIAGKNSNAPEVSDPQPEDPPFPELPKPRGEQKPDTGRQSNDQKRIVTGQHSPHDDGKPAQACAAQRGTGSIAAGSHPAPVCTVFPDFALAFLFMTFNQTGAGWKNGGEGQEQPAYARAPYFGHNSGQHRRQTSEEEPQQVFMRLCLF